MAQVSNPKEKEKELLEKFLDALNKAGIKYEHYPEKSLIRIEGTAQVIFPIFIPMVEFYPFINMRVEVIDLGDAKGVVIRDYIHGEIFDFRFPKNWKFKFTERYLEIYY
jgi:hypothetical protein